MITRWGTEEVRAYVPPPLPPVPPIRLDGLQTLLAEANLALGRLDGQATILPNVAPFLYAYVRKEAVLSSQIEGTQSSLSQLLLFENHQAPGVPLDDVQEVSNYVAALTYGLERLRSGFPLSLRLIREIHGVLLSKGRGAGKDPGEFRRSQNWIGGTRPGNAVFVPPPPDRLMDCLSDLERFLHSDSPSMPVLIKAALAHVQFESIHPFLDGKGRIGRLLITFLLCASGTLREPILYLSLFLKAHRSTYYDLLTRVRETGDWEAWIEFFLTGVKDTAEQATRAAARILALFDADRRRIESVGRPAAVTLRVFQHAQRSPLLSIPALAQKVDLAFPTVSAAIGHLEKLGIVREITGRQRDRVYAYTAYLAILNEETEPV